MTEQNRYEYIIYKICSDECDKFYIGSTRNMVQRKKLHKSSCNNPNSKEYNLKKNQTIRDNGGWDEWRMVPLELMENTTKFDAECREEVVRCELQAKLNSRRASCGGITREEYNKQYYEENIDHIKEHNKQYYEENIDHIKENEKKYYQENKEQLKEKQKIYYQENIDHIKEQKKKYREENREQINAKQREKIDCQCGGKYTHNHKTQHLKTKKHQNYLLIKTI